MNLTFDRQLKTLTKTMKKDVYTPLSLESFFVEGLRMDDTFNDIDTSKVVNFTQLYHGLSLITKVPPLDTSSGTVFNGMFSGCSGLTSIPSLNTSNGTNFNSMFFGCSGLTSIPPLDTSNGTKFDYMFSGCSSLTSIPPLDTSNGTNFRNMFKGCSGLTSIPKLDINNTVNVNDMFTNCANLTDLYLYNIRKSLIIGSGTTYGHLLTVDSLVHTLNELCLVTSQQTLIIGTANLEKLSSLYCKIVDNTTEKKPMVLCESTDEGAMTINQYVALKNWKLS